MPRIAHGLLITLQILFAGSLYAQEGSSADYFPMHVGDTWYYDWPPPQSNPWAMRTIRDSLSIGGRTYYRRTYGDGVDGIDTLRRDSVGNIRKFSGSKEYILYDFQADSGTTYRYELDTVSGRSGVSYYYVLVDKYITARIPAGTFEHCVNLWFKMPRTADNDYLYTFAPNVGLIIKEGGYGITERLTSAFVNGVHVVSVDERTSPPTEYTLHQNYPNPFNPSTTITYELPNSSEVRLSVFDMLGREVSVLVNERNEAGVHDVKFDGSNVASGVYVYRLTVGDFVQSKKLVLLK